LSLASTENFSHRTFCCVTTGLIILLLFCFPYGAYAYIYSLVEQQASDRADKKIKVKKPLQTDTTTPNLYYLSISYNCYINTVSDYKLTQKRLLCPASQKVTVIFPGSLHCMLCGFERFWFQSKLNLFI